MKNTWKKIALMAALAMGVSACESGSLSLDNISMPSLHKLTTTSNNSSTPVALEESGYSLCAKCIIGPDGVRLTPGAPALNGVVEKAVQSPDGFSIEGWAADTTTGLPADYVLAFINGELVAQSRPALPRPTLAQSYGLKQMENSGFRLVISPENLTGGQIQIQVFAVTEDNRVIPLNIAN